jgi:HTH-type transcriptional regulator, transcriptional repressor of NAD biosynthesis genes
MHYKTGLVIGKFYPLHKGHQYLIETAMKSVDKLTIIVCHTASYSISPEIRAGWIKQLYKDTDVRIFRHDPELDSSSVSMSKIWAHVTLNFLEFTPEVVFTSERYGKPYSEYLGCDHVLVDLPRKTYPISGTEVRSNPYKNWDYLDEPVRAYFSKRIVILGAESTGTTTLAVDLAKHYKTVWVPEYGRMYYEGRMYSQEKETWKTNEFIHIQEQQNAMEEQLAGKCSKILICDTDALATVLWHERYVGSTPPELERELMCDKHALYIVTDTDIPFVQDGTRDGEHIRQAMHKRFIQELKFRHLNFMVVSGSPTERVKKAIERIEKL